MKDKYPMITVVLFYIVTGIAMINMGSKEFMWLYMLSGISSIIIGVLLQKLKNIRTADSYYVGFIIYISVLLASGAGNLGVSLSLIGSTIFYLGFHHWNNEPTKEQKEIERLNDKKERYERFISGLGYNIDGVTSIVRDSSGKIIGFI